MKGRNRREERKSMERADKQPGGRRLVLGFDAGCLTCSELAKKIEERVGDKIEVRSLNDPLMEHWRKEVFGEAAPWGPTLVEIKNGTVRAWSGARMGVRLSRVLGPLATWRVMQVLGEANAELELADSAAVKAVSGLTRGQFLKGLGGAAVAMSVLSGTGKLPPPAEAASSIKYKELTGDALVRVARRMAGRKDVVNVMGPDWRDRVKSGRVIDARENGSSLKAIDLGDGRISSVNGEFAFSGDLAVIKAAKHTLSHGNSVIAVSYAMPKRDRFVAYFEYEKPTFLPKDQVKTKTEALLYRHEDKGFVLEKASSNRHSQILLQEGKFSTSSHRRDSCLPDRRCDNPCDIAYGYSSCHRITSIRCIARQCRVCAVACFGGPLLCAGCALVICSMGVIRECCRGGYGCKRCGWCH
jgi:hypothetical protein